MCVYACEYAVVRVTGVKPLQHGPFSDAVLLVAFAVLSRAHATGVDNGFVSFSQQQVVDVEPDEGSKAVVLPMQRTGGTSGTIRVFVSVS